MIAVATLISQLTLLGYALIRMPRDEGAFRFSGRMIRMKKTVLAPILKLSYPVAAGEGEMDYRSILRFLKARKPYVQATLENTANHNAVQSRQLIQRLYDEM
jgi:hypothetical protein